MAIESFRRVEHFIPDQWCIDIFSRIDEEKTKNPSPRELVVKFENLSLARLSMLAQAYINKHNDKTKIYVNTRDKQWVFSAKGAWKYKGNEETMRLVSHPEIQDQDAFMLFFHSKHSMDSAEKSSILNQLYLGLLPYAHICIMEGRSMFKAGRMDVSELSGEDLKEVFSDLEKKELDLILLPSRNYIYRQDGNICLSVIRELNIYLPSIQFPNFESIEPEDGSFKFPSPLGKGILSAREYFYSYLRDELEFLAQSSPLIRVSQHDITSLAEGNDEKILKMLHRRGYPAIIEGPYVVADSSGHCSITRSLIIELPEPPEA